MFHLHSKRSMLYNNLWNCLPLNAKAIFAEEHDDFILRFCVPAVLNLSFLMPLNFWSDMTQQILFFSCIHK